MVGLPVLVGVGGSVLVQSSIVTPAQQALAMIGPDAQASIDQAMGARVVQDGLARQVTESAEGPLPELSRAQREAAMSAVLPPGDRLVPVGATEIRMESDRSSTHGSITTAPADALAMVSRSSVLQGEWPSDTSQVAVGSELADRLHVGLGDSITITDRDGLASALTVSAITSASDYERDFVGILGAVKEADYPFTWYVAGSAPVTWDVVQKLNAVGVAVRSRAVIADPPPTPPELESLDPPSSTASTAVVIAAVAAIGLLEVVLLIGPAYAVGARRAERQLAVIASAGGERRTLRHVVLLGAIVIGTVSSVLAAVLGLVGAVLLREYAVNHGSTGFPALRVPWGFVALSVVLGVLLAVAAAWLPARRAAGVDVVAALAGRRAEARPRRRVPIIGLVLIAVGVVCAAGGAVRGSSVTLVLGVLLFQIGIVSASGALITLVGRLAPRAGVAGRLAMRDAARQRSRTAPAVAAVIAAIAGVVAGAIYMQSAQDYQSGQYVASAATGRVLVSYDGSDEWGQPTPMPTGSAAAAVQRDARTVLGGGDAVPVRIAKPLRGDPESVYLEEKRTAEQLCPTDGDAPGAEQLTDAQIDRARDDPRCYYAGTYMPFAAYAAGSSWDHVLVDDGTTVSALGVGGADALRAGRVLVGDHQLWPDGTAHLVVREDSSDATPRTFVVPAAAVPRFGSFDTVLPPAVAETMGIASTDSGFVLAPAGTPTEAQQQAANLQLTGRAHVYVERGYQGSPPVSLWILVGAAVVVGLGATALAMALAAAEFRPDLATLAAVGASPRVRRRVSAAQSGVVALLGVGLGCLSGLMLGWVLVLAKGARRTDGGPAMVTSIPWEQVAAIAIGVPLLAIGGAYVLTRSRLPLPRRLAT